MPVVAKFFAAVQAGDIGTRALSLGSATRTGAYRDGKTVPGVPATEHGVQHLQNHRATSTELKATKPAHPLRLNIKNELQLLRFFLCRKGSCPGSSAGASLDARNQRNEARPAAEWRWFESGLWKGTTRS